MILTQEMPLSTRGDTHIIDITEQVRDELRQSGLTDGLVTVFCPGSTGALTTIEYEPGAVSDFKRLFTEIAATDRPYQHNQRWGDGNGHSHVRAALLGPSLTVPFAAGNLTLGTWQQIIFIDFDNRPRQRTLVVQIMGEAQ